MVNDLLASGYHVRPAPAFSAENTMPKHTPGPWRVRIDINGRCLITNDAGVPIGEMFLTAGDIPRAELEANAALVSSTPKLLEACLRAMRDEPDESLFRSVVEDVHIPLKHLIESP